MENEIINRLDAYKDHKGLNDHQITVQCGLSIGVIGNARKSGKGMSSPNVEKILLTYKDLNARWLLTGEGEMLDTETVKPSSNENQFLKKQNKELIEKIEKLSRELGDKERQLMELRKERAQYLIAAESSEADKYGLHKSKDISSKEE